MPSYINETYGNEILKLWNGDKGMAKAFMGALQNNNRFTNRVVTETKDSKITEEVKKETVKLLQELVYQVKSGITLNDMQ